ncbi:hypothetical protein Vretimale_682 [Volvox reticuliferus]|uniref:Uncharacterized protein n=1 Tax=Volvox reticuliferus TaxID=1737510 RepID=A0A8J4BXZ2_9CHLO|nr:hypothetical protein Vretifemale_2317 [Volvox reticuliferus]GIL94492.1 hypothetical protein Vretimale_682 [Volvox reticuliferus]
MNVITRRLLNNASYNFEPQAPHRKVKPIAAAVAEMLTEVKTRGNDGDDGQLAQHIMHGGQRALDTAPPVPLRQCRHTARDDQCPTTRWVDPCSAFLITYRHLQMYVYFAYLDRDGLGLPALDHLPHMGTDL